MTFAAPLGREVKVLSAIGAVLIGTPIVVQLSRGYWLIPVVFSAILVIATALIVRGYELVPGELRVRRLWWATPIALGPSACAKIQPNAMQGSWRVWGNGGIFAITGHFSGSGLGRYRAFVTDPVRTVVLDTGAGIVVVSPDRPEEFVAAVGPRPARTV